MSEQILISSDYILRDSHIYSYLIDKDLSLDLHPNAYIQIPRQQKQI